MSKPQEKSLRYFMPYLLAFKGRISFVFILLIIAKIASVLAPIYLKGVVDFLQLSLTAEVMPQALLWILGTYFGVRSAAVILGELKDYLFSKVEARIVRNVSKDVYAHLLSLSMAFHLDKKTGSVANKIERGVRGIEFVFRFSLFNVLPTLIEIIFIIGILLWNYHWSLAAFTLGTLIVYVGFTIWVAEARASVNREMNKYTSEASGKNIDGLGNIETVKVFGNEPYEIARYDESLASVEATSLKTKNYLYLTNIGQGMIITIGMIILLYIASKGVLGKTMTIGDFTLITAYIAQLSLPLGFLGFIYRQIKDSLVSMEDMFSLLNINADVDEKADPVVKTSFDKEMKMENVVFKYNKDRTVLKGISLPFPKGKTTALVGSSGSGKSTVAKLLLRFYDTTEGAIEVDGVNIKDLSLAGLRSLISIVPQDSVLFNDTVRYNIAYGNPEASMEEIEKAAKKANIHDLIASLPEGYETRVGERGLRLSGGEKQRVAIARVILKGSPIIIFDEATSSLDSKSEAMIQRSIGDLAGERTLVVIAHRLSTIERADNIVVMDHGQIVEQGTHKELLDKQGAYFQLWSIQQKEGHKEEVEEME